MHRIEISRVLLERLAQERGGRLHLFDTIDPARTAHVVIDLQNGFMEPGAPPWTHLTTGRASTPGFHRRAVGAANLPGKPGDDSGSSRRFAHPDPV
jgi:hypothetical protein